ncbi:MAG: glycosyltransferase family 39 protein [Acidobacteria bacterium]|nr:glycosyltransferase family 39 protein [Acidobacteriota bacterium]
MPEIPEPLQPASPEPTPKAPRIDHALLLLTLAAFVVRALYLLLEPHCGPTGDEPSWIALGIHELGRPRRGLDPLRVKFVFYPPLYPYFIAVLYRMFGTLAAVQWVQAAIGSLLVPAVGRVGIAAFGRRAGLLAGAFVALYPDLIWFSGRFWSETLFMVFLWWAVERTLKADASRSTRAAAVAGLLFGLAVLTRELALYLAPIAALWLLRPAVSWRPSPHALRRAAALLLGLVVVVAPWTLRNAIVFKAFIPVSTMGGLNLWQGNTLTLNHLQIYEITDQIEGPVAQDRYCRRMAWESIRDRQPLWIFEKLRSQMPEFWKAGSEIVDQMVGRKACGPLPARTRILLEIVTVGPWLLLLGPFLLGLARVRWNAAGALLVALLAAYNLAHVVALATTRYRLPVVPVVFMVAAALLVGLRQGGLHPLRGWRLAFFVALCVVAVFTLAPGLPELDVWQQLVGG